MSIASQHFRRSVKPASFPSQRSIRNITEGLSCGGPCCKGKMRHCPAHKDTKPSLHIEEYNGTVLLHCFSGCTQEDVLGALKERSLW